MPNTKDIVLFDSGMFLFKGENGTGKTIAAGSFYKKGKVHIFDFDGKVSSIKYAFPDADISYKSYGLRNYKEFRQDFQNLQDKCPDDVIVVDSLTSFTMTVVLYILEQKGTEGKREGGTEKKLAGDIQLPTWDEVNGETVEVAKALEISKILSMMHNKTVIWTAHPIAKLEVSGGTSVKTRPIVTYGYKVCSMVPTYFSEIYHFENEKTGLGPGDKIKRTISTQNTGDDYAKTALGLPTKIDWTDDFHLYEKIRKSLMTPEQIQAEKFPGYQAEKVVDIKPRRLGDPA